MPCLAQVLARPRKASRQSRPTSLRVPALRLRRIIWQRMSCSELLCAAGSQAAPAPSATQFVDIQPRQQPIEPGKAGAAAEDTVEARPQRPPAALTGVASIEFEVSIEVSGTT